MRLRVLRRFPFVRLVLVVALAGLWVRSRQRCDLVGLFDGRARLQVVGCDRGEVVVAVTNVRFVPERAWTCDHMAVEAEEFEAKVRSPITSTPPLPGRLFGVTFGGGVADYFAVPNGWYRFALVPFAYPMTLAGASLAWGLSTWWRRRRWGTRGTCGGCGYDLRASSGRCPECGASIPEPHDEREAQPA